MILFTMDEEDSLPTSPEIGTRGFMGTSLLVRGVHVTDFWTTGAWRGRRS